MKVQKICPHCRKHLTFKKRRRDKPKYYRDQLWRSPRENIYLFRRRVERSRRRQAKRNKGKSSRVQPVKSFHAMGYEEVQESTSNLSFIE